MSISYSNNHGVQVTLHGVSDVIPTNSDYRYVIPGNFALDDPNISFDSVKDEYYRKVLSEIGRYLSGVDYKHYDDPRCSSGTVDRAGIYRCAPTVSCNLRSYGG